MEYWSLSLFRIRRGLFIPKFSINEISEFSERTLQLVKSTAVTCHLFSVLKQGFSLLFASMLLGELRFFRDEILVL